MSNEPPLVIENRKILSYFLCMGAELEHAIMCQYLYAAFSLRTEVGPGLTEEQLEAVNRWRRECIQIAGEEMLHWAMVNNLLTAIGSAPFVSRPHLPHQAKGYPAGVQLRLLPFGESALQHFCYLERPLGVDQEDGEGFEQDGPALGTMHEREIVARGQDFTSVGHLYRSCEAGLANLVDKLGHDALFIGPAYHQADQSTFGWPDLAPITDLASAQGAIQRIVEHGEGATDGWEDAHYGRFVKVLEEYRALRAADPSFEPAHPVLGAGVRATEGIEPEVYITDAETAAVSDLFNAVYELILQLIARYFAFGSETDEEREVLTHVAVGLMFRAITPLGHLLAGLPVGDAHPGMTAGANFQLPYRANFLIPHRRSAWIRFSERLTELAAFAKDLDPTDGHEALAGVSVALDELAAELTAHVSV